MLSEFILSKVEELGTAMNSEILSILLYNGVHNGTPAVKSKGLKENITDFRACWKAIKAGNDVRGMLSILSARLERTKDPMKMKKKVGDLLNYIDNYDEFKGEELANIPWESINLWSK